MQQVKRMYIIALNIVMNTYIILHVYLCKLLGEWVMQRFDYRSLSSIEFDTMIVENEMYVRVKWVTSMYYANVLEKHKHETFEWYYADFILCNEKDLHKVTGEQKFELERLYERNKKTGNPNIYKN